MESKPESCCGRLPGVVVPTVRAPPGCPYYRKSPAVFFLRAALALDCGPAHSRQPPSNPATFNHRKRKILDLQRGEMMSSERGASERGEGKFWLGSLHTVNDPTKISLQRSAGVPQPLRPEHPKEKGSRRTPFRVSTTKVQNFRSRRRLARRTLD